MGTLKPYSNGPLYSNMVIGTLVADRVGCCIWYSEEGPGWVGLHPVPSLLYHMYQPTHQQPVYQLHIIQGGTVTTSGL